MNLRMATYHGQVPAPPVSEVVPIRDLLVFKGIPTAEMAEAVSERFSELTDAPLICLAPGIELESLSDEHMAAFGWVKSADAVAAIDKLFAAELKRADYDCEPSGHIDWLEGLRDQCAAVVGGPR
jgi:hypothetical protein